MRPATRRVGRPGEGAALVLAYLLGPLRGCRRGQVDERCRLGLRTQGLASMNRQRRSSTRLGVCSADHNGPAVIVRRERRWNTTSVSRETTGRFGIAARKRGLMPLHERRCVLRCLCWPTPETMNNHPAFLPEESLRSEEIRSRQVLAVPRFHVKHGKQMSRRRKCVP